MTCVSVVLFPWDAQYLDSLGALALMGRYGSSHSLLRTWIGKFEKWPCQIILSTVSNWCAVKKY